MLPPTGIWQFAYLPNALFPNTYELLPLTRSQQCGPAYLSTQSCGGNGIDIYNQVSPTYSKPRCCSAVPATATLLRLRVAPAAVLDRLEAVARRMTAAGGSSGSSPCSPTGRTASRYW